MSRLLLEKQSDHGRETEAVVGLLGLAVCSSGDEQKRKLEMCSEVGR